MILVRPRLLEQAHNTQLSEMSEACFRCTPCILTPTFVFVVAQLRVILHGSLKLGCRLTLLPCSSLSNTIFSSIWKIERIPRLLPLRSSFRFRTISDGAFHACTSLNTYANASFLSSNFDRTTQRSLNLRVLSHRCILFFIVRMMAMRVRRC
jgi:hypothetical protein